MSRIPHVHPSLPYVDSKARQPLRSLSFHSARSVCSVPLTAFPHLKAFHFARVRCTLRSLLLQPAHSAAAKTAFPTHPPMDSQPFIALRGQQSQAAAPFSLFPFSSLRVQRTVDSLSTLESFPLRSSSLHTPLSLIATSSLRGCQDSFPYASSDGQPPPTSPDGQPTGTRNSEWQTPAAIIVTAAL